MYFAIALSAPTLRAPKKISRQGAESQRKKNDRDTDGQTRVLLCAFGACVSFLPVGAFAERKATMEKNAMSEHPEAVFLLASYSRPARVVLQSYSRPTTVQLSISTGLMG